MGSGRLGDALDLAPRQPPAEANLRDAVARLGFD